MTRNWNSIVRPNLSKVHGDTIRSLPTVQLEILKNSFHSALLDTGSYYNLISNKLFLALLKEHKFYKTVNPLDLCAANQSTMSIHQKCQLIIKINKFSWKI